MGHDPRISFGKCTQPLIPCSSGPQQNRTFLGPQKASFIILVRTRMTTLLVLAGCECLPSRPPPPTSAPLSSAFPSRSTPLPLGDKVQQPGNEQAGEVAKWIKEALL